MISASRHENVELRDTMSLPASEMRSPGLSSNFSQADTVSTTETRYTSNTGGRARQSWNGESAPASDPVSYLDSPALTSNLSETETDLTGGSRYTSDTGRGGDQTRRDGTVNFWHSPYLSNDLDASSLVNAKYDNQVSSPTATSMSTTEKVKIEVPSEHVTQADEPRSFFETDSESEDEAVIATASRTNSMRGQRPQLIEHRSNESTRQFRAYGPLLAPPSNPGPSISKVNKFFGLDLKDVNVLTPAYERTDPTTTLGGPSEALSALTANALEEASTVALAQTPPSPPLSFTPSSVLEDLDTATRAEALDILPSPLVGFGTPRVQYPHTGHGLATRLGVSAVDGLRSNALTYAEKKELHRAMSAPTVPRRDLRRKVTIRPADLHTINTDDHHKLFRDSVVSTPYPLRKGSMVPPEEIASASAIAKNRTANALLPLKEGRRRGPLEELEKPSLATRPSILFLELALARYPSTVVKVEIEIRNRTAFDDEKLFLCIRKSYNRSLLGFVRRYLSARTLHHIDSSSGISFDHGSFGRHLRNPELGRGKKTWVLWFQNQQGGLAKRASDASELFFSPRFPFAEPKPATPFKTPLQITFHFQFSLIRIALAVCSTLFFSCMATALWVLFGLPGLKAGKSDGSMIDPLTGNRFSSWEYDAEQRVLTGLVLGVLVFLLGTLGGAGWIGGSWILL